MNFKNMLTVYNTYIHIPFCLKKCNYCDFTSFSFNSDKEKEYLNYLLKEIKLYKKNCNLNEKQDTIYFGGGTPSLLSLESMEKILSEFNYDKNTEITIEINPKTVNIEKLKKYKNLGINRLSIGTQTFNNHYLKLLGRVHSEQDAIKIYNDAREIGFDNISLDLMFALPNQTLKDLEKDLDILFSLNPNHFSIYSLIWEEGTNFYRDLTSGKLKETENELEALMFEKIIEKAKENNYIHYEISNFSKENFESRHNKIYWENKNYLGLGLAAAGYLDNIRYKNFSDFQTYFTKIDNNILPIDEKEILSLEEIQQYSYLLKFRILNKEIEIDNKDTETFENLVAQGYLMKIEHKYKLTQKGLMYFNDFVSNFI